MALGTPVVSTRKGIEGLDLEPGRDVLVADDSRAFAAHVLRVLGEPALAGALSINGHRLVRDRYGWDAIGDALDAVVRRAAAAHASRRAAPDS
jgi:glycosyltransferase involved in cell wall biosynthesis